MNPLNYFRNRPNHDQHLIPGRRQQLPETGVTELKDLPIEVRVDIWKCLSAKDHKAIRQQCKQFKWEIDQVTGVNAILTGPTSDTRWIRHFSENPEFKRAEDNLKWVSNSIVRSLNTYNLIGLKFEPKELLTNNTHILHRLQIRLEDYLQPKVKVMEILNMCKNLRVLDILCRPAVSKYPFEDYRTGVNSFHQEILQSLVTKPHLKELSISANLGIFFHFRFTGFLYLGTVEEPGQPIQVKYTSTIQTLKIKVPILKNSDQTKLSAWKDFIDQQTGLIELEMNLGLVHWTYFSNVIRNNQHTLKKLALHLSNWEVQRTSGNWDDVVPLDQQLDWTRILTNPGNLTSLKVFMSTNDLRHLDLKPHPTRNFSSLDLNGLTTLELRSVFLTAVDFIYIFTLQSLTHVKLNHWTTLGQPDAELTEIARTTLQPALLALLTKTQLLKIDLMDMCISKCPGYLRNLIENLPNYTTDWPALGIDLNFVVAGQECQIVVIQELTITRKPEDQLIPPITI